MILTIPKEVETQLKTMGMSPDQIHTLNMKLCGYVVSLPKRVTFEQVEIAKCGFIAGWVAMFLKSELDRVGE